MTRPLVRLIDIPVFSDSRGSLGVAEAGQAVPFSIARLFYLFDLAPGTTRGFHAHRQQHQFVVMVAGACRMVTDDGTERKSWEMSQPRRGLYLPPMIWLELDHFSTGAVCAVLTSDGYDEADYVRNYGEFSALARSGA